MLGLVNGQKDSYAFTQGIDMWELPGANYEIRYDSSAKTYTYEVKLPMVQTNILSDQIALSASVGSHYTGAESANRFNSPRAPRPAAGRKLGAPEQRPRL